MTFEEKAGLEELAAARAHRKTIASERQAVQHRVEEGEMLLQSLRTEVLEADLRLREADEHIGFIQNFLKKRKLYRLIQAPLSGQKPDPPPSSPPSSPICSHTSTSKTSDDDLDDFLSGNLHVAEGQSMHKSDLEERSELLGEIDIAALPVKEGSDDVLQEPCLGR